MQERIRVTVTCNGEETIVEEDVDEVIGVPNQAEAIRDKICADNPSWSNGPGIASSCSLEIECLTHNDTATPPRPLKSSNGKRSV